jgi:hypothetical protein
MRPQITSIYTIASSASLAVVYDIFHSPFNVSLFCVASGTVNYTIQHTGDDITNLGAAACTWFNHDNSDLVNATTNQNDNFMFPVSASRIYLNSGSGNVVMTSIQAGSAGGPT